MFYVATVSWWRCNEVSGGREGLVELSDLSHQDRVLQTSLQSKLIDKCLIQQVLIHSLYLVIGITELCHHSELACIMWT